MDKSSKEQPPATQPQTVSIWISIIIALVTVLITSQIVGNLTDNIVLTKVIDGISTLIALLVGVFQAFGRHPLPTGRLRYICLAIILSGVLASSGIFLINLRFLNHRGIASPTATVTGVTTPTTSSSPSRIPTTSSSPTATVTDVITPTTISPSPSTTPITPTPPATSTISFNIWLACETCGGKNFSMKLELYSVTFYKGSSSWFLHIENHNDFNIILHISSLQLIDIVTGKTIDCGGSSYTWNLVNRQEADTYVPFNCLPQHGEKYSLTILVQDSKGNTVINDLGPGNYIQF